METINTGYKLEIQTQEKMNLLGSTEEDIIKDKNGENVPKVEITDVVLLNYNMVNKNYQQTSKVLFTFVPNKAFGQLINISTYSLTIKTVNSEFLFI